MSDTFKVTVYGSDRKGRQVSIVVEVQNTFPPDIYEASEIKAMREAGRRVLSEHPDWTSVLATMA